MSQRLGMADGRCFSINTANSLLNDHIMKTNGIDYQDNYSYRKLLQSKGPAILNEIEDKQKVGALPRPNNQVNQCQSCNVPLLAVPDTY